MPIQPSEETNFVIGIVAKVVGFFMTFVGGVVTATWVVAGKVKGFDDRLSSVEGRVKVSEEFQVKVDQKLDRIHDRIDDILLKGKDER